MAHAATSKNHITKFWLPKSKSPANENHLGLETMMKTLVHVTSTTVHYRQTPFSLSFSFSHHNFALLQPSSLLCLSNNNNTNMPCSSKTLMDFFPQSNRNPKRLKTTSISTGDGSLHSVTPISDNGDRKENPSIAEEPCLDGSCVSAEQKARMELKKCLAKAKRNLKICSDKVHNSKAAGDKGYVKLDELLVEGSWLEALPGELEKPYAKNLCKFVQTEICGGSQPIYPPPQLIFNALNSTPFDKVKVVILGQDPYHGPGQAMGLSFSVPQGVKIPPSLMNMFKELKEDLGCSIPSHGNLERWTVQGVLLLNTVLTVRHHQANSHAKKGWEQFTDAIIRAISEKKRGVVFILWGNCAQEKSRLIDGTKHHILKSAHPSGLSANRGFFGCRHFSRTNQILEQIGESPIDWQL